MQGMLLLCMNYVSDQRQMCVCTLSTYICISASIYIVSSCTQKFCTSQSILHDHYTDCSVVELWDLPAADVTFILDVSLLEHGAQYPSCDAGSVGSAVLVNTTLNTATVAHYSGTTPGSAACFVCDESSGYTLNTSTNERVCQRNITWSGSSIVCGKSQMY